MTPILYKAEETTFDHLGLGVIDGTMQAAVTRERNGEFILGMLVHATSSLFDVITYDMIIKCDASYGQKNQRFKVVEKTVNERGTMTILAEHISYEANGLQLNPLVAGDGLTGRKALELWANNMTTEHPFTVWSNVQSTSNIEWTIDKIENGMRALGGTRGSILDHFNNAEYEFDNYSIKLHTQRGKDTGVIIAYGKNLLEIEEHTNIQETATSIMPYSLVEIDGKEQLITLPEPYYVDGAYVDNYARRNIVKIDFSDEEIASVDGLRKRAERYLKENSVGMPKINAKIKFLDLVDELTEDEFSEFEQLELCDIVTVYYPELGINGKEKVVKTMWDVVLERYNSIEIGTLKTTLAGTVQQLSKEIDNKPTLRETTKAALDATEWLLGGDGGNIQLLWGDNRKPYGLLAMDKENQEDAQGVLLLNYRGLGISDKGADGPFENAITSKGINATVIRTGRIEGANNKDVYFDLDKGHLRADRLVSGNKSLADVYATIGDEISAGKYGVFTLYASDEPIFNVFRQYELPGMTPTGGITIGRGIDDNGYIIMDDEEIRIVSSEKLDLTGRGGLSIWGANAFIDNVDGVIRDMEKRIKKLEEKVGL